MWGHQKGREEEKFLNKRGAILFAKNLLKDGMVNIFVDEYDTDGDFVNYLSIN